MYVGVDIEQFVRDPYGSGIQRVLQFLAREWPSQIVSADFVVPADGEYRLLSPDQAATVISIPFTPHEEGTDLRQSVGAAVAAMDTVRVKPGDLLSIYDAWLLPEVSYLPSVLERFELFRRCVPTTMIGYDTLPMSEPANYRFRPGTAASVSEYFRLLATAGSVVCISGYARDSILERLRRDPSLPISVAHPGGDHLPARAGQPPERTRFVRLGTMEARKHPREILGAFEEAVRQQGLEADLVFVGGPSASDDGINAAVSAAVGSGLPVTWVQGAGDDEVHDLVQRSSAFLSVGTEGYGIPVLEAIRLGTPVLFDGVQPAGDLMVGHGAARVPAMEPDDLVAMFTGYAQPGALTALRSALDAESVPTWSGFAEDVAQACTQAR